MQRLTLEPGARFTTTGAGWAVFNTAARIDADGEDLTIERFDAIALDAGEGFVNRTQTAAQILHIVIASV